MAKHVFQQVKAKLVGETGPSTDPFWRESTAAECAAECAKRLKASGLEVSCDPELREALSLAASLNEVGLSGELLEYRDPEIVAKFSPLSSESALRREVSCRIDEVMKGQKTRLVCEDSGGVTHTPYELALDDKEHCAFREKLDEARHPHTRTHARARACAHERTRTHAAAAREGHVAQVHLTEGCAAVGSRQEAARISKPLPEGGC